MLEFIIHYWLELLFSVIIGILTYAIKQLVKKVQEQDEVKDGVIAMLHDRLFQAGEFYINRGYITIDELHNIEYLYNSYHNLGGNGTGTAIWNKLKELPSMPPSMKKGDEH